MGRLTGELGDPDPIEVVALVVERHGHVQRVPGHDDVGRSRVEHHSVERRVGLHEPAVVLRREVGLELVPRQDEPVHPGGQLPERGRQLGVWNTSSAQIICTHVVPLFERVLMTMSPSRYSKSSQRPLSSSGTGTGPGSIAGPAADALAQESSPLFEGP